MWSAAGGLAATLVATLGAGYLSVVDRGPEWTRTIAIVLGLGLEPFWWTCGVLTPRFGGPTPWLLALASLVNVAAWTLAIGAVAAAVRRIRLR